MTHEKGANSHYWTNLYEGIYSSWKGLSISIRHFWAAYKQRRKPIYTDNPAYFEQKEGIITLRYPLEKLPLPENARYQLHNEMDDCIVCDKCAKICPVDCIEIEPIKATEQVGTASDGSPIRLYAAKFDIDMAKCCFCGLCTTVCPTECLTMTDVYDFSHFDIKDLNHHFATLSPEEAEEKKKLYEQFLKEKEANKANKKEEEKPTTTETTTPSSKPKFVPKIKPKQ